MFRDPETGHKQKDLKGEGVFHFSASVQGVEYITGGDTACQGVSAVFNGQMIDRLVQTAEYQVMVTKEQFELTQKVATAMSMGECLKCAPWIEGVQEPATPTAGPCPRQWTAPCK